MEAIFAPSPSEQSVSPYSNKQIKNPRRNARAFISKPSENLAPTNIYGGGGGLLFAPQPSLFFSYPPSASLFNPLHHNQHHRYHHHQQQPPPLLPLPIIHNSLPPARSRGLSCPLGTRKTRDQSLTPKKSKKPTNKREEPKPKNDLKITQATSESLIIASTNPLGPDPNDLPKDISKVLSSSSIAVAGGNEVKDLDKYSGSVFTLSPPPSSLPLPKFSVRSKLSCKAEAAGIDAGATDKLRRILRLR